MLMSFFTSRHEMLQNPLILTVRQAVCVGVPVCSGGSVWLILLQLAKVMSRRTNGWLPPTGWRCLGLFLECRHQLCFALVNKRVLPFCSRFSRGRLLGQRSLTLETTAAFLSKISSCIVCLDMCLKCTVPYSHSLILLAFSPRHFPAFLSVILSFLFFPCFLCYPEPCQGL